MPPFLPFDKIARLSRMCTITEKIDGTNGIIYIGDDADFHVGSRTRWLQPDKKNDNYGFARWAYEHKEDLLKLGPGYHYGEWWGNGIQRGYGLREKRFSLFNTFKWSNPLVRPECCHVVPVLAEGEFHSHLIGSTLFSLAEGGSKAAPGFFDPEGVVIYHQHAKMYFKKTLLKDEAPKGEL